MMLRIQHGFQTNPTTEQTSTTIEDLVDQTYHVRTPSPISIAKNNSILISLPSHANFLTVAGLVTISEAKIALLACGGGSDRGGLLPIDG
jgi:hypothetical protein